MSLNKSGGFVCPGCTVWFTGLSGSGKTTCSRLVADYLKKLELKMEILDGDIIRTNLSKGLGFTREDRNTNIRRIGFVCDLLTRNGVIVCAAAISPFEEIRREIREKIGRFVLVHCTAPLEILEERDVKGLYKKARAGEITNFTGISHPYEDPKSPDVVVRSDGSETPEQSARKVLRVMMKKGYIPESPVDTNQWSLAEDRIWPVP